MLNKLFAPALAMSKAPSNGLILVSLSASQRHTTAIPTAPVPKTAPTSEFTKMEVFASGTSCVGSGVGKVGEGLARVPGDGVGAGDGGDAGAGLGAELGVVGSGDGAVLG